jgi:GNAT superfamily N-acetyltransferase
MTTTEKINLLRCITPEQINATYKVMQQLRPALSADSYYPAIEAMLQIKDYSLIAAQNSSGECLGVMGYTLDMRLSVAGKMLYIDDLVINEGHRSQGIGQQFIDYAKQQAISTQCQAIVLDSALFRHRAHKFYLKHGFKKTGYNFKLTDLS